MSTVQQTSVFTGFKTVKFPSYTVICPQTGNTFDIRCLNVSEVLKIKESLITSNKMYDVISHTIWGSLESKPDHIVTYEDFLNNVTTKDREALIYGLYHSTFGDSRPYSLECGNCGNKETVRISLDKSFSSNNYPYSDTVMKSYQVSKIDDPENINPEMEICEQELINEVNNEMNSVYKEYPKNLAPIEGMPESVARGDEKYVAFFKELDDKGITYAQHCEGSVYGPEVYEKLKNTKNKKSNKKEVEPTKKEKKVHSDILQKRVEVELPISKIIVHIKQPTLKDEKDLIKFLSLSTDEQISSATETLIIERIEEYEPGKKSPIQVITDKNDIIKAFYMLPSMDRNALIDRYEEEFGQYEISLNAEWECNKCDTKSTVGLNLIEQFFRAINIA